MPFLRLRNVSVEFPVFHGNSRSLKRFLLAASSYGNIARDALNRVTVHALTDVTVDIEDGDRVGLIGLNGAGKSTLLKVLAGIHEPTRGELSTSGRITALLTATLGFNPEATGRDNIILRGLYMNIHPAEMRKYVDQIAEFTELGHFLDLPVRMYSSGMMVRLAFAASTCVRPEILLMDEWLGSGDERFLAKAQKRLADFVGGANILVLASHSLPLLQQWCSRGVLLDRGQVKAVGPIEEVCTKYHDLMKTQTAPIAPETEQLA